MNAKIFLVGMSIALVAARSSSSGVAVLPVRGVLVRFQSLQARKKATLTWLHEKVDAYVATRFTYRQIDWVFPSQPELRNDWQYLADLCRYYKRSSLVKSCEPNIQLVTKAEEELLSTHEQGKGASSRSESNKLACSLVSEYQRERLMDGTLSPFWAQEYVGADLAQDAIAPDVKSKKFKASSIGLLDSHSVPSRMNIAKDGLAPPEPKETHFAGTYDTVANHHGLLAGNLVNGPSPAGVAPQVPFSHVFEMSDVGSWVALGAEVYKDDKVDTKKTARIYNISMALGYTSDIAMGLLEDLSKHSILVVASGNDWPKPLDRNETLVNSILVGSLYPQGYIAHDSSEGEPLDIAAPSDALIQSTIGEGKFEHFGGTSGAAPLVSGTLGLVMGFLPDLDVEEARLVLRGTALKTSNSFQSPQRNGAGMLNTLKAVMVAQKLSGKSKDERKSLLNSKPDVGIFDFKAEATEIFSRAVDLLALEDGQKDCGKRREGFKLLRTAFLLHPTDEVRQKLIELYRAQGLVTNAEFYENLDRPSLLANLAKDAKSKNQGIKQSVARTSSYLPEAFPIVADLLKDATQPNAATAYPGFPMATPNILDSRTAAVRSLTSQFSPSKLKELVLKLQSDPAADKRALAPLAGLQLELGAMNLISGALSDKDPIVVQAGLTALKATAEKDDKRKFEYFSMFVGSSNQDVRLAAAEVGTSITNEPTLRASVRLNLLGANDPKMRSIGIAMLDASDSPELLRLAKSETDKEVLQAILSKASAFDQIPIMAALYENKNADIRRLAVSYFSSSIQNSNDISLLARSLSDQDKTVRQVGANALFGLGIAIPQEFDRFRGMDRATLSKMDDQILQAFLEQWGDTKQVAPLWSRSWALTWFKKNRSTASLSNDKRAALDELITAAEAANKKGGR